MVLCYLGKRVHSLPQGQGRIVAANSPPHLGSRVRADRPATVGRARGRLLLYNFPQAPPGQFLKPPEDSVALPKATQTTPLPTLRVAPRRRRFPNLQEAGRRERRAPPRTAVRGRGGWSTEPSGGEARVVRSVLYGPCLTFVTWGGLKTKQTEPIGRKVLSHPVISYSAAASTLYWSSR